MTRTVTTAKDAIIYLRLSDLQEEDLDENGNGKTFKSRVEKLSELASRLGWNVCKVIIESDVDRKTGKARPASAFKRKKVILSDGTTALRVIRPGFRDMLDHFTAGRADALLAEDLDRCFRDPRDLEDMIDVCEAHKINARSLSGSLTFTDGGTDAEITMADLPELIAAIEATIRSASGAEKRQAQAVAADLYGLLRTVLKRVGRVDLSLLAADRAQRAAEQADDPIRMAGARWNLAQVLLSDKCAEEAEDVAMSSLSDIRSALGAEHPDAMALSGALLLVAAVAALRAGRVWAGRDRLREAAPLAERIGNRNVCWTAFGPINVAMYAVSIEVESGEAVEGLRLAAKIDHERSPSIERRVAFLLDQAKGYLQRREYPASLALLEAAEAEAPEDVRFRPAAHALVRSVMERGRRGDSHRATQLAARIGLPF